MPRPRKPRRVCSRPDCTKFFPQTIQGQPIMISLDEYEVIRLIDLEGMRQEQCAEQMDIARTTVQAIYASARKKIATCIVKGQPLHIDGGDVQFCEHRCEACGRGCCRRLRPDTSKEEETEHE